MPKLPFADADVLLIDQIGKNISGSGMDPNVIGRSLHGYSALLNERNGSPSIRRILVRDLTPESHGNVVGVGLADFTAATLEATLKETAKTLGVKNGLMVHPARFACTGKGSGPSLYHLIEVLGKDRVLARMDAVLTA